MSAIKERIFEDADVALISFDIPYSAWEKIKSSEEWKTVAMMIEKSVESFSGSSQEYALAVKNSGRVFPKQFSTFEEAEIFRCQRSEPDHWTVIPIKNNK